MRDAPAFVACAQCGRTAPADRAELARWKGGDLLLAGQLDELSAALLLCPECVEAEQEGGFEEGGGD
jgi:hypothetical protein